jgi:hypothetical protein
MNTSVILSGGTHFLKFHFEMADKHANARKKIEFFASV